MSDLNLTPSYWKRAKAAVSSAEFAIDTVYEFEQKRDILKASLIEVLGEYARIIEAEGGEGSFLNRSVDSIKDDLADAFQKAIDASDEEPDTSVIFGHDVIRSVARDGARS